MIVAKDLPPLPSAGGSYLLDSKKNQWVLVDEAPAADLIPESTNGTVTEAPAAGED